jgi:hypothetical protein
MECLCSAPRRHVSGPANAGKLNNIVDLNIKNVYVLLVVLSTVA